MSYSDLIDRRKYLIELMLEVGGRDYTLGWLRAAYIFPDTSLEDTVVERTIADLEAIKTKEVA